MIGRLLQKRSSQTYRPSDDRLASWFGGGPTLSGVNVTEGSAMTFSAVYRAMMIYAQTGAQIPKNVIKKLKEGGRENEPRNPAARLIYQRPNDEDTQFVFWEAIISNLLGGNAVARIERNGFGEPANLWRYWPNEVTVDRLRQGARKGKPYYIFASTDRFPSMTLEAEDVLHFKLYGRGLSGQSIISLARETIGSGLAMEQHGAAWFSNAGQPSAVMNIPYAVEPEVRESYKEDWRQKYVGPENRGRLLILGPGETLTPITISNKDAEYLASRKFTVVEIARWFGLPPHMLGEMDSMKFRNLEESDLNFVKYGLLNTVIRRIEDELWLKLLDGDIRRQIEFNVDGLLRGDFKTRTEGYHFALQDGWMNINEVRALENWNPVSEEDGGNTYARSVQLIPAGRIGENIQKPGEKTEDEKPSPRDEKPAEETKPADDEERAVEKLRPIFDDAMGRIMRAECSAISKAAKLQISDQELGSRILAYYDEHEAFVGKVLSPAFRSLEAMIGAVLDDSAMVADFIKAGRDLAMEHRKDRDKLIELMETRTNWGVCFKIRRKEAKNEPKTA